MTTDAMLLEARRVTALCLHGFEPANMVQLSLKLTGKDAWLFHFLKQNGYRNTSRTLKKAIRLLAGHVSQAALQKPIMIQTDPCTGLPENKSVLEVFNAGPDDK